VLRRWNAAPRSTSLISAIHFAIEQESDFQPQNDVLKFPFAIAHFNCHSLLFPNLVDHMSRVIMPFITWPQNAQYKMYGEICYIGLVLAILTGQKFNKLAFFYHHCVC